MMGPSHRVAGVAAWLAVADLAGVPLPAAAAGTVVAAATSHGRLSPDMDNYPWLGRIIPGNHRGVTHWWPLPLLLFAGIVFVPHGLWWAPAALAVAWASHIAADWVFGAKARNRGAGIPVWRRNGRWIYHGVGLRANGKAAKVFTAIVLLPAVAYFGARAAHQAVYPTPTTGCHHCVR